MRRGISHRQLEAFRAVIESGTVTAAAERLFITQPAASRLVRDLEETLGLALFERRGGRLAPTVEAETLYEEVERSFSGLDRILQAAEDIRHLARGTLHIASMPALALSFLPRVIRTFSERHPGIHVSMQVRSSVKVMEWMASQQFDVGFAAVREVHPAVTQEAILEAPLLLVMPRGHRLEAKRVVVAQDLEGEPFVSLGPELNIRSTIDQVFADAGVARRLAIDTQLSAAVCAIVAEGAGVALVDPVTGAESCERGAVSGRPFRPAIAFRYTVLCPLHRSRSVLSEEFLALVKRELAARLAAGG